MDISTLVKKNTTIVTDFYLPDGTLIVDEKTDKPAFIEIYGPDSDEHNEVVAKRVRELQLKKQRSEHKRGSDQEPATAKSISEQKERDAETLAEMTVSWGGWYENEKPLECTKENAKRLYLLIKTVAKKVDRAFSEEVNFLEVSKTS